jgi:hypothetical protein
LSSLGLVTCKDTKTPALLHNFQYTARLIKELHEEQSNLYNLLNSIQKMINRSLIKPNDLEGLLFKAAHTIEKIRQLYGELMYGIDKYRLKKV